MLDAHSLDDPRFRRRALAAWAVREADSLERARVGGRDLGVPFPHNPNPTSLRRWAEALERANGFQPIGQ